MNKILSLLLFFVCVNLYGQISEIQSASDKAQGHFQSKSSPTTNLQYVNPFIGTGGHGHTYPGASAPFGMMQLSPDTRHDGWDGCSGYHYSDSTIYGFSHTHLSGTGVADYCDLLVVPQLGKPKVDPGYTVSNGYGAHFSHQNEVAEPGYYAVRLDDPEIDVELTVSERAGMHKYRFNEKSGKRFILIDLDHRDKVLDANFNLISKTEISGKRFSNAWATEQHFYFHLELNIPYQKARIIKEGNRHKLLLIFSRKTEELLIRVGMSAVSEQGAYQNLKEEINHWDFQKVKEEVQKKWESELNKIDFESWDDEINTNFYTALYHSFLCPNIFNDVDGKYRGRDNKIHQLSSTETNYTLFSLWDTYRATHPLFTIIQQERTSDFINTFLRQYQQGGDLPVWELAGNETECMIGYHSVSVMADAMVKNIAGFNYDQAITAAISTSNFNEYGKTDFSKFGFIPYHLESESVSKTLEYAYDDFCISQMLKANNVDDSKVLMDEYQKRALNFINIYNPNNGFMQARSGGLWYEPFNAAEVNFNYTEANSWQYSLYAPHAINLLSQLHGGADSLESFLDRMFNTSSDLDGRHQVDITGLIGQYAHGNEPSHHAAYLYNYTNTPYKTQLYIDSIEKTMYNNAPDGLSGNEDCGQMSSWYVLSALGLYQIAPGNPVYDFGRPLMSKAIIYLESGNRLQFVARNNNKDNKYIQKVLWNGKPVNNRYISHSELMRGGKLEFIMGNQPKDYASEMAPSISTLPKDFVPTPFLTTKKQYFDTSIQVGFQSNFNKDNLVYFTVDGSDPKNSPTSRLYTIPFTIDSTTTLKFYGTNGVYQSETLENTLIKRNPNVSVKIFSQYDDQYAANEDFTLIDGLKGSADFRTGNWQGYWGQDFDAELHFEELVNIEEVEIDFLSDMKSWIFLPEKVTLYYSFDGTQFIEFNTIDLTAETEDLMPAHIKTVKGYTSKVLNIKAIKVVATSTKECPDWSLGKGNPTWLFVDEISFR